MFPRRAVPTSAGQGSRAAPHRLTLTAAPEEDPGEPLTVDLEDLSGRTRMLVVQRGNELTEEQYAQAQAGWDHFFDVMAELLAPSAA